MTYNKQILKDLIKAVLNKLNLIPKKNFFISPIQSNHKGHYCSNLLFLIDKNSDIEKTILDLLLAHEIIKDVEIVRGYINITLTSKYFAHRTNSILIESLLPNIGNQKKVNVEYCSVNPTGYLHIGHARNAVLGDSIARILEKVNYNVTKEYYVNDGGNQINIMADSIYARLHQSSLPENGYKGEEMIDVAKLLPLNSSHEDIQQFAIQYFLEQIKKDLQKLNIHHDSWIFESKVIEQKYIEKALEILDSKGYIEHNTREEKRVQKGEQSTNKLMLLKTTLLGDDLDRPLTKSDGSWTYLAPDIGYHLFKIERDFEFLICVLGSDHDSYAKRIKIATKLLNPEIQHETAVCQMVSFENEGELVKFSKRMGNSIKISDFITEINPEILRFMILEKSADTQFVFNYENAVNITMKNPLFYCQYAFARACSILRNANEQFNETLENIEIQCNDEEFFTLLEVQNFIIHIDQFEQNLIEAAKELAPHKIITYTKKLCEHMHKLWQIGKTDAKNRIISENKEQTLKRIQLIKAFIKTAKEAFYCIGIIPKERME